MVVVKARSTFIIPLILFAFSIFPTIYIIYCLIILCVVMACPDAFTTWVFTLWKLEMMYVCAYSVQAVKEYFNNGLKARMVNLLHLVGTDMVPGWYDDIAFQIC